MFGKKKEIIEPTQLKTVERETKIKLDRATSKLAQLEENLKRVLAEWEPLDTEKKKLSGDIDYYRGRVEKLKIRLREEN